MSKRSANESAETPEPKRRSLVEALNAPRVLNPTERLGVKVYSSKEIAEVDGTARAYRQFWNTKASEICGDPDSLKHLGYKKKAIEGAITTSWVMRKVELEKNVERMQEANFTVNHMYEQAAKGDLSATAMKKLEMNMSKAMSELKKAQESLRKALSRKREDLVKFKEQDKLEEPSCFSIPVVSELEESTLAQGVLDDDDPGSPEIPLQA